MRRNEQLDRRAFLGTVVASAVVGVSPGPVFAQKGIGERKIDPLELPLDKPGVWTLHFRYKPIRIVTLDGFGKDGKPQKQLVWYLWYQVYNLPPEGQTPEPVTCFPEFELVTKDTITPPLLDEPQPFLVSQLNKIENPQDHPSLRLLTTIEISKRPIPPSKRDAIPRVVTGVAVWTDMTEKAPKTNKFSVYISGLSNGQATEELREGEKIIKRKTLQINFVRPTDDTAPQATDIRPDDTNAPAEQWIYRTSSIAKAIGRPKLP
ncbi:MAG: hypothetical protein RMJ56_12995 [Gemmataceae bacterium]|nr:hypothetical protein [Gemmata sp.]MDW8198512.1 hypothetical protein [Gemmataceae bacterium]